MSEAAPIKNKKVNDLADAPTPQNTPATAASSFAGRASQPSVSTIAEEEPSGEQNGAGAAAAAAGALGLANNPALLSMIQGKLGTLVGKPSGYIDSLPQAIKDRIAGLKGVQAEHAKLEAQFQAELLELEKRFFKKYEPLYERRAKIINGGEEPTSQEVEAGKELNEELEAQDNEDEDKEEATEAGNGIPDFWLTALRNLVPVAETIGDRDEEALRFLTDVRMQYLEKPGFALVFEFSENPFFENKTLTKTYYYQEETGYGGDFIYDHAEGDEIKWKSADNNLTVRIEKRKQRNKHTKATRTIEKTIPTESFFQFFSPPKAPSMYEEEGGDEDEDDMPEDLEERLELDYQLGEEIKEKLIPRAVDWYTGEALEYEDLNEFDDEEDYDDEDLSEHDHDDEDGSDDDDEEEEGAQGGDKSAECKQQ